MFHASVAVPSDQSGLYNFKSMGKDSAMQVAKSMFDYNSVLAAWGSGAAN